MSGLALYFLGPPRIVLDGAPVAVDRRKATALLAYIAVTAQRHSRDELAELFFSRQNRENANANLRKTLTCLRSAIGGGRLGADRLNVWLPGGNDVSVDVAVYQRLLKSIQIAENQEKTSAAYGRLVEAAELYKNTFLAGFYLKDCFAFEEWQLMMQESFQRQQASVLRQLSEIHELWGQYEQAIDYGQKWLSLDALEETAHRRLMELHSLAGRHAEAVRQYEKCRSVLERELGEQPAEETERLREQIEARRHMPGTTIRQELQPDGKLFFRRRLPENNPLFLFIQTTADDTEQEFRQEAGIRESVAKEQGRFFKVTEQGFYAVFSFPDAAVRGAMDAQIRTRKINRGLRLALVSDERNHQPIPSGLLVEHAEQFLEILHAGQILLNETAADLLNRQGLPEGTTLLDLGPRRLKDLGPPQHLYLLQHSALLQELPHLETLDRLPNNLPIQPTRFIGRATELKSIQKILRSEDVRLLTLVGAGGTGKTRLALQAAAGLINYFQEGVFFVDLTAVRNSSDTAETIASTLAVREYGGEGRSIMGTLKDYLAGKRLLLILDNFEHLQPAAPQIAELLAACPLLKILASSREALHLKAEKQFPVQPMLLPSPDQSGLVIMQCEAVRLFTQRAAAVRPTFQLNNENVHVVAEICRRVDGLPLAIELAATYISVLTPQTLIKKLHNRLKLLKGGPVDTPQRQQTLRREIDWSHELLDSKQQAVFMRLSVFPSGCTLDAAEAVCPAEPEVFTHLSSLVEKSLLRLVGFKGDSRYRMLETIRDYAGEKLKDSGEIDSTRRNFATHILQFAEQTESELYGPDQMEWFDRIDVEYGNIREALSLMRDRKAYGDGLRLAGALGWYWFRRGRFAEGQHWLRLFHDAAVETVPPANMAKAAYFLGWLKLCVGNTFWGNPEGKCFFEESLRLWREAGNLRGMALSQVWLGWKDNVDGKEDWAVVDEGVENARRTGDPWAISWCLKFAYSHLKRPDLSLSHKRVALEEAISLARKTKDPFLISQGLNGMGNVFSWNGDLNAAERMYLDSMRLAREINDSWSILNNINCLADGYLGLGRFEKAKELYNEGLRLAVELGARGYMAWFVGGFYILARHEGLNKRALRLGAFSESILNPDSRYNPRFAEELGLDGKAAEADWNIGRSMSPEQAVAYAFYNE